MKHQSTTNSLIQIENVADIAHGLMDCERLSSCQTQKSDPTFTDISFFRIRNISGKHVDPFYQFYILYFLTFHCWFYFLAVANNISVPLCGATVVSTDGEKSGK